MNVPLHVPRAGSSGRVRLLLGVVFAVILAAAMAAVPGIAKAASICSSQTGTNGGYYYQMWIAGQGSACITLNSGNSYSTTWSGIGDFVAGVGWNPGNNSTMSFSGSLSASGGTSLVSLYGWSTNPLVEYYVIENYVGSPPTAGTYMGQMTSDGGTYNIYEHQQVNQPCIRATADLRAVPGDPDLARQQRDHHHAELLQRVGQPRHEPGHAQLPDTRH